MKPKTSIILSTSPPAQTAEKPKGTASLTRKRQFLYGGRRRSFAGKERDPETGLLYFGARYLDPKASRWLSADPALGEYVPSAPVSEEARKRNGSLPGMGGVFNYVNLHAYHYAGNNPVKYTDPNGLKIEWFQGDGVSDADYALAKQWGEEIKNSDTEAGKRWRAAEASARTVRIYVNNGSDPDGKIVGNEAFPGSDHKMGLGDKLISALGLGGDAWINFNPNDIGLHDGTPDSGVAILAHEMAHAYLMINGRNPWTRKSRELDGTAVENQYRDYIKNSTGINVGQREIYGKGDPDYNWNVPQYNAGVFSIYNTNRNYRLRKVW